MCVCACVRLALCIFPLIRNRASDMQKHYDDRTQIQQQRIDSSDLSAPIIAVFDFCPFDIVLNVLLCIL